MEIKKYEKYDIKGYITYKEALNIWLKNESKTWIPVVGTKDNILKNLISQILICYEEYNIFDEAIMKLNLNIKKEMDVKKVYTMYDTLEILNEKRNIKMIELCNKRSDYLRLQ